MPARRERLLRGARRTGTAVGTAAALALGVAQTAAQRPVSVGVGGCAVDSAEFLAAAGRTATAHRDLSLRLNLPAFRLDVLVDGAVTRSIAVAIGERRYATPVGDFTVTRVIWNPWWIPPASEWARDDIVTPPGPENPMGKVKLLLGGAYYLHGTPYPVSIGRALSHGCVRLRNEDAVALARLVSTYGDAAITPEAVDSLAGESLETRAVDLPRPVPIRIVYELAEVRGDSLALHRDVYGRARGTRRAETLEVLASAGFDTARIDGVRLASALRRARTRTVVIPLHELGDVLGAEGSDGDIFGRRSGFPSTRPDAAPDAARLSGSPISTIGFEPRFNRAFGITERETFVAQMLRDTPPRPPDAERVRADNLGLLSRAA